MVDVAQLVRVPDCDSGGRGFETHRSPQLLLVIRWWCIVTIFTKYFLNNG